MCAVTHTTQHLLADRRATPKQTTSIAGREKRKRRTTGGTKNSAVDDLHDLIDDLRGSFARRQNASTCRLFPQSPPFFVPKHVRSFRSSVKQSEFVPFLRSFVSK